MNVYLEGEPEIENKAVEASENKACVFKKKMYSTEVEHSVAVQL